MPNQDQAELSKLLENIENAPKHVLFRRLRKSSNSEALNQLLNMAMSKAQDGVTATWGKLDHEELYELVERCQTRINQLQSITMAARRRQYKAISDRPYLAPQLQEFDPHGKEQNKPQDGRDSRSDRGGSLGSGGQRPARRVRTKRRDDGSIDAI